MCDDPAMPLPISRARFLAIAPSLILFLIPLTKASAQNYIHNSSFEDATLPTGGNSQNGGPYCNLLTGTGSLADWTPSSTTVNAGACAFAPTLGGGNWTSQWWAGNNIAYLRLTSSGVASLSQTISAVLENNTTYSLSALIGRRETTQRFNYSLQLWAGSTLLSSARVPAWITSHISVAQITPSPVSPSWWF